MKPFWKIFVLVLETVIDAVKSIFDKDTPALNG